MPQQAAVRIEWERVFGPAIEAASRAMSIWTQGRVTLSLDEIRELPLVELGEAIHGSQEIATVVALDVRGDVGGQFLLTVDDDGAADLAGMLLNRAPRPFAEWGEIERSALMETGNILGSAYLSALTNITGLSLFPSPPQMLRDYLVGILEQAVMAQAIESDYVLLARTCFRHLNHGVDWNVIFVPSPDLMEVLRKSITAPNA
ncbi:MAG: chemotaxis protein CheC [Planctomycetia bacterium]|nr:chemotaxis protein CheC [Planctomycetia bacterium]